MRGVDVAALHAVTAAVDVELFGAVEVDAGHVEAVLARPGFDPERDGVVVWTDDGEVAAWAWVNRRSEGYVRPGHRGRGLGAGLVAWIEARAIQAGTRRVVQQVPDADVAATRLLRGAGFDVYQRAWRLGIDTAPVRPVDVDGVTVRGFSPDDAPAAHRVTVAAFADWGQRPMDFEEWAVHTFRRSSFRPEAATIAVVDGEVVGALVALDRPDPGEAVVESLAVAAQCRGRGVARALLTHSFAALARAGRDRCTVWTHGLTGAKGLYERAGMSVDRTMTVYAKDL